MQTLVENFEKTYKKSETPDVRSGDTVRVHQRIIEGSKERVQIFEGVVIRTHRKNSINATLTVRRASGGIGVEKTFMIHAPNTEKVEVLRRSKVRRNYLSYLRRRSGKSARLREIGFKETTATKKQQDKKTPQAKTAKSATSKESSDDK